MFHKIADWFEKKGVNHTWFAAGVILMAALMLAALVFVPFEQTFMEDGKPVSIVAPLTSLGNLLISYGQIFQNVSALFGFFFASVFFLHSVGFKVWDKVREDAVALALVLAGLAVALGLCIKG